MADIVCRELCKEVKEKTRLSVTNTQYVQSQRKRVKSGRPINDSAFLNDDFDVGSNAASSDQDEPISNISMYSEDPDSSGTSRTPSLLRTLTTAYSQTIFTRKHNGTFKVE